MQTQFLIRDDKKINQSIANFHKIIRKRRAFKKVEELSGINLEQQSQKNILAIYKRLRYGEDLSPQLRAQINREKIHLNDALTPEEFAFFQGIIDLPLIGNHASTQSANILASQGYVYSAQELGRRHINAEIHVNSKYGENDFVFMSYTYPQKIDIVNFVGPADIFLVNLDVLSAKDKIAYQGFWSSGHFYAYDQEQFCKPIRYKTNSQNTKVYTHYSVDFTPTISYQRTFTYERPDGEVRQTLTREMEISVGRHIKLFHVLRLIEFIRYLDSETRHFILKHFHDKQMVAELFNTIFTPGKAELHAPAALQFNMKEPDIFEFVKWRDLKDYDQELYQCIEENNEEKLKDYISQGLPLHFYRYNYKHYILVSLLNLAVLKNRPNMVRLLLKAGADPDHEYANTKQGFMYCARRRSLQEAIEKKDFALIQLLCESVLHNHQTFSTSYCASVQDVDMYTAIADKVDDKIFSYLLMAYQHDKTNLDHLLSVATYYQNIPAMEILLRKGANPNATLTIHQDSSAAHLLPLSLVHNHTALSLAAEYGLVEAMATLLKHGADVNVPIKEEGMFDKFGRGETPLQKAVSACYWYEPKARHDAAFRMGEVDNCRYSNLPEATEEDYIKVLIQLLRQGADVYYTDGAGHQSYQALQKYLGKMKQPSPELMHLLQQVPYDKNKIVEEKSGHVKEFDHYGYALITCNDPQGYPMLIIGDEDKSYSPLHYGLPGGSANYMFDKDLKETTVNLTAYQTNLDLKNVTEKSIPYTLTDGSTDDDIIQIHHFGLPGTINDYAIYHDTPDAHPLEQKRSGCRNLKKLKNIHFISLKEIQIEEVNYKGIPYPVCRYRGRALPPFIAPKIVGLYGHTRYQNDAVKALAYNLYFTGGKLMKESIDEGNLTAIRALVQLGLKEYTNLDAYIIPALLANQKEILNYLFDQGILLSANNFDHFCRYKIEESDFSEEVLLAFWSAHKHLKHDSYCVANLAKLAGEKGYTTLCRELGNTKQKYLLEALKGAVKEGKLGLIEKIFSSLNVDAKEAICADLLDGFCNLTDLNSPSKLKEQPYKIINAQLTLEFILKHYQATNLKDRILHELSLVYERLVECNAKRSLLESCLACIKKVIQRKFKRNDDQIYGVYIRLMCYAKYNKKTARHEDQVTYYNQAAKDFLLAIDENPIIQILHAKHEKNFVQLDALLSEYADNKLLKKWLREKYYSGLYEADEKDERGDSCLQRAVKNNKSEVVYLLLSNFCKETKENEWLNERDKAGKTPLENAINLGFMQIAKLLILNGAEMTPEVIESIKTNQQKELVNFIPPNKSDQANATSYEIVMVTEAPLAEYNKAQTGDVDYAKKLAQVLNNKHPFPVICSHANSKILLDEKLKNKKNPPIVHLLLNAPHTGFALDVNYLQKLQSNGIDIIITALEFAKYREDSLKKQTLDHFRFANRIIFLDENDKHTALRQARMTHPEVVKKIENAEVISVPPTISEQYVSQEKTDDNIMSFGMLRRGKGMAHVLHLAEIIKNSAQEELKNKKIYIVGSVSKHKTRENGTAYDATLYKILCAMYPQSASRFNYKSPDELIHIYKEIRRTEKPALPIELYLDVEEKELPSLFAKCKYAFNPAFRGATLRNSSISTTLAYGCVLYSHEGSITPSCLQKNGEYRQAMVLFEDDNYKSYADNVAQDIISREKDDRLAHTSYAPRLSLNDKTKSHANKLLQYELSPTQIVDKHETIYNNLAKGSKYNLLSTLNQILTPFGFFTPLYPTKKTVTDQVICPKSP